MPSITRHPLSPSIKETPFAKYATKIHSCLEDPSHPLAKKHIHVIGKTPYFVIPKQEDAIPSGTFKTLELALNLQNFSINARLILKNTHHIENWYQTQVKPTLKILSFLAKHTCEQIVATREIEHYWGPKNVEQVAIYQEKMDFDLVDAEEKGYVSDPQEIFFVMQEILKGLAFLEGYRITHTDIKPENIMIKLHERKITKAALIDMDFAFFASDEKKKKKLSGSVEFFSPELQKAILAKTPADRERIWKLYNTPKRDVWATGLTLAWLVKSFICPSFRKKIESLLQPQEDANQPFYPFAVAIKVATLPENFFEEATIGLPPNRVEHLLVQMLQIDPEKRFSASQALKKLSEVQIFEKG